jgi:hypothetical protein
MRAAAAALAVSGKFESIKRFAVHPATSLKLRKPQRRSFAAVPALYTICTFRLQPIRQRA